MPGRHANALRAMVAAPLAWSTLPALASQGVDVFTLVELVTHGWADIWYRPDGAAATLTPLGAERLHVEVREKATVERVRHRERGEPRRPGLKRSYINWTEIVLHEDPYWCDNPEAPPRRVWVPKQSRQCALDLPDQVAAPIEEMAIDMTYLPIRDTDPETGAPYATDPEGHQYLTDEQGAPILLFGARIYRTDPPGGRTRGQNATKKPVQSRTAPDSGPDGTVEVPGKGGENAIAPATTPGHNRRLRHLA